VIDDVTLRLITGAGLTAVAAALVPTLLATHGL
jgi:hypothetical protein